MPLPFEEHISNLCQAIPPDLGLAFAPARYWLSEWRDCWIACAGVDEVRTRGKTFTPVKGALFNLRFENQLGLAALQPVAGQQPVDRPVHVEVISPKFPTPQSHLAFLRGLLDDLFIRAARLPFAVASPTGRGVAEALRPPTPLFTLHFLCQCAPPLRTALEVIQAAPHRRLTDLSTFVPLADVTEADADVLVGILHASEELVPASGFRLAQRLRGFAPARVWQRRSEETYDTPENRFVLSFLRQLLAAADMLPRQPWWDNVPWERQVVVRETSSVLRQAIAHPLFSDVGPLQQLPLNSQVLLRRDGYRDMVDLWQVFHHARRPLFAPLERAMEVRDVATLYETWVFFALVEEIASLVEESPAIDLRLSDEQGLGWRAEARFGTAGQLVYNRTMIGYSVPLRPDFTWVCGGREEVVLDAKFRLERPAFEPSEDEDAPEATASRSDLYKMHTYRDALGVRAAVCVYPGDAAIFYDRQAGRRDDITLRDALCGGISGIGALPMQPGRD